MEMSASSSTSNVLHSRLGLGVEQGALAVNGGVLGHPSVGTSYLI